ncbi:NAD(P)H-hydrate dehydratase, partial [Clavibacter lycopersici]
MTDGDDARPDGPAEVVTPAALREWALPQATGSKYGRGQVVVVGGALRSPGAAMISGLAALRVGAGRLTLAVGAS